MSNKVEYKFLINSSFLNKPKTYSLYRVSENILYFSRKAFHIGYLYYSTLLLMKAPLPNFFNIALPDTDIYKYYYTPNDPNILALSSSDLNTKKYKINYGFREDNELITMLTGYLLDEKIN